MRVYRSITAEEITNLYQGKSNHDLDTIRGENTHSYQSGVEYIHFFRYSESAEYYHNHPLGSIHNPRIVYMVANIPNSLLKENLGYGYYNGVTNEIESLIGTTVPLPEYCIPKELLKPEYIVDVNSYIRYEYKRKDTEYQDYLKLVTYLLENNDYNHYKVGDILKNSDLETLLCVSDDDRTEREISRDKIKEFEKIRDDLRRG